MIIGKGDIASVLVDRKDLTFFASGVSNSQETRESEFKRETELLWIANGNHIVYFSSLSIYEKNTPYTLHKRRMEQLVKDRFKIYTIIRLGNITWGKNPNTIINFLKNKIKNNEPFEVKDEYKYICGLEEFQYWIKKIPPFSTEMNITGNRIKVSEIVQRIKA